jgi:hypothetical protein
VAQKVATVMSANVDQLSDWHDNAGKLNQLISQFN